MTKQEIADIIIKPEFPTDEKVDAVMELHDAAMYKQQWKFTKWFLFAAVIFIGWTCLNQSPKQPQETNVKSSVRLMQCEPLDMPALSKEINDTTRNWIVRRLIDIKAPQRYIDIVNDATVSVEPFKPTKK